MKDASCRTPAAAQYRYRRHWIRLGQERENLRHSIMSTEEQLRLSNDGRVDAIAGTGSDRELLLERLAICRQRLEIVLEGLERIRDGSFGRCAGCEAPIGKKRLQALASARYCIRCQERLELEEMNEGSLTSVELELLR